MHLETLSKPVAFTIMGLDKIAYRESVDREKGGRQILGHPSLKNGLEKDPAQDTGKEQPIGGEKPGVLSLSSQVEKVYHNGCRVICTRTTVYTKSYREL